MNDDPVLREVDRYYTAKIEEHGPSPRGVDWSSSESQQLRFSQLLKVCTTTDKFSLNDFGCGYGALLAYMASQGMNVEYRGFDISQRMIDAARNFNRDAPNAAFFTDPDQLESADYTVASGIFNVRLDTPIDQWAQYMLRTIDTLSRLSSRGFAFNALTRYSDAGRMRADLYYADPAFFFDYCKTVISRHVALLHDYGLYEFTIIVRK